MAACIKPCPDSPEKCDVDDEFGGWLWQQCDLVLERAYNTWLRGTPWSDIFVDLPKWVAYVEKPAIESQGSENKPKFPFP